MGQESFGLKHFTVEQKNYHFNFVYLAHAGELGNPELLGSFDPAAAAPLQWWLGTGFGLGRQVEHGGYLKPGCQLEHGYLRHLLSVKENRLCRQ